MTSKATDWAARRLAQEASDPGAEASILPHAHAAVPRSRQLLADLALLVITIIWGGTFVMVKDAVAAYPVFSFLALRFTLAALALMPLVLWQRKRRHAKHAGHAHRAGRGETWATTREDLAAVFGASGELGASLVVSPEPDKEIVPRPTASETLHAFKQGARESRLRFMKLAQRTPPPRRGSVESVGRSPLPSRVRVRVAPSTRLLLAPFLVGLALFAGYGFQTGGLQYTTPAKAGFITGLSVVIVPLVAALILRQSPGRNAWLGIGLATAGLVFLAWQPGQRINAGDALVFLCALSFAAHILLTGRFAARIDPLLLTLGQLVTVAVLSAAAALAFETRPPLTGPIFFAAAFTGLLATSVAFGIQTAAQRFTTATHTALILSAEPVFAALFSLLLIGEALGPRQLAGSALILAGMLAAEFRTARRSQA